MLTLEVITRKKVMLKTETLEVTLPGEMGELGVLTGHVPLLTSLSSGLLSYGQGKDKKLMAVHYGFAEIFGNRVTVLAKDAQTAEEIDGAAALAKLEELQGALKGAAVGSEEEAALTKELAQARTKHLAAETLKALQHQHH